MIIYKITNIINHKCYVGQTVKCIRWRLKEHIRQSKYNKTNSYFHRAIRKYGWDSFKWKILCECDTKKELDEMEFHFIKQYHSYVSEYGYNLTWGGEGNQLFGKDNPMYGKIRYDMLGDKNFAKRPEVRKKISDIKKGCKRPDLSLRNKNNSGKSYEDIYGVEKAKKIKEQQSKSRMGKKYKPMTQKGKDNISKAKCVYQYEMISPEGKVFIIDNMNKFAINQNLNKSSLLNLVHGRNKKGIHKGWKGRIL